LRGFERWKKKAIKKAEGDRENKVVEIVPLLLSRKRKREKPSKKGEEGEKVD